MDGLSRDHREEVFDKMWVAALFQMLLGAVGMSDVRVVKSAHRGPEARSGTPGPNESRFRTRDRARRTSAVSLAGTTTVARKRALDWSATALQNLCRAEKPDTSCASASLKGGGEWVREGTKQEVTRVAGKREGRSQRGRCAGVAWEGPQGLEPQVPRGVKLVWG